VLTISQLAAYAGVSVRTVRHYHERGLLPEPERDQSGYRRYDGRAIVDLVRIRTLANAGVPLSRLPDLLDAGEARFASSLAEIDRDLVGQIDRLQRHRQDLAKLATPERLCLPESAVAVMDRLREIGLSERTLAAYGEGWILMAAVFPEALDEAVVSTRQRLADPGYVELLQRAEEVFDWDPEDPRLLELADLGVEVARRQFSQEDFEPDPRAGEQGWQLVADHNAKASPAWARLGELIDERVEKMLLEG
jgi:DNA-binding transcriptional MerR regulator